MGIDHVAAYEGVRERVSALLDDSTSGIPVPACRSAHFMCRQFERSSNCKELDLIEFPWSVHDVVAHLTGLAGDWVERRLEGYATGEWTGRQVHDRKDRSPDELTEEWADRGSHLKVILESPLDQGLPEPLLTGFGPVPSMAFPNIIVTDAALHEHDIRGAIGTPGARSSGAVEIGMLSHVALLRFVGAARGLPDLALTASDTARVWRVGRGEPTVSVTATAFELFRSTGGRRSLDQIASMEWQGPFDAWREHLIMPRYSPPASALVE